MFTISLLNYDCKIKITSASTGAALTAGKVVIQRREDGESTWYTLFTKTTSSISDLNYVFVDKYTRSRLTYHYKVTPYSGSEGSGWTAGTAVEDSIECNFDSLYISDDSDEYFIDLNLSYDISPNVKYTIQDLVQSKYPRFIQNGISDYEGGTFEGLLLNRDTNGRYVTTGSYKLKRTFKEFLKNGSKKYIKTPRGDAMLVFVKPDVTIKSSEYEDICPVSFSVVEAGDPPMSDYVESASNNYSLFDYGNITDAIIEIIDWGGVSWQ